MKNKKERKKPTREDGGRRARVDGQFEAFAGSYTSSDQRELIEGIMAAVSAR